MEIKTITSGPFSTNAYLIKCSQTNQALIIDPAPGCTPEMVESIEQTQSLPIAIICTHSHLDHTADIGPLLKIWPIPVWAHRLDQGNIVAPGSDGLGLFIPAMPQKVNKLLEDGDILKAGDMEWKVIHTPGHTPGGICLYEAKEHILISGDTLFNGTIGNLSFPGCSPASMWKSLKKLALLPPNTKVFPGHGPWTTIGQEKWLSHPEDYFS